MGKIRMHLGFLLALFSSSVFCQVNHAVLIGVDTYKDSVTWNSPPQLTKNINEVSDFFKTSEKYRFRLTTLLNKDVVVDKIKETLLNLDVSKGDHVMIYLTGHGCQVDDKSGKKKNAKQQGFICYDTPARSRKKEFENTLLLGDSIGVWLTQLRKRIGPAGQVFILVEACYSGLVTRGDKKSKQAHFIEENISNVKGLAPLVVFSSSRASNQTASVQKFTILFLGEFKNFKQGSYYDLFNRFYLAQRKEILARSDIQLAVNLDVDDPGYLRIGVFEDSIYAPNNFTRIIEVSPDYDWDHQFKINRGIFEGVTQGSTIKITKGVRNTFSGSVELATNGSSWVRLTGARVPARSDLWEYQVQIDNYKFQDTLFVSLDMMMPDSIQMQAKNKLNVLKFVRLEILPSPNGYSLVLAKDSLFIRRNSDTAIIGKVPRTGDLRSAILRIAISRFIGQLHTTKDSTVSLGLQSGQAPLSDRELTRLKPGDSLLIKAYSKASGKDRYYCLLHLQDGFISQLAPVHFQDNESECKLPRTAAELLIDSVKVGKEDGSFLLITSETPFDLRQMLLNPLTKTRGRQNKMEKIISNVLLDQSKPLYNPDVLKIEKREYKIERELQEENL